MGPESAGCRFAPSRGQVPSLPRNHARHICRSVSPRRREIGQDARMGAHLDWQPPEPASWSPRQRSRRSLGWRIVIALVLPAVALEAAFPVLHAFTTVYNEPSNVVGSFIFYLLLTALPGLALACFVRNKWLFGIGVTLSMTAAFVVAVQIATTDDGQAGLAALGLPFYIGIAVAILAIVDVGVRGRVGSEP